MDSLDIQVVDSLTVNLNQEDYSTEGQVLNSIDVYVEDEQLLFDAALTLDSINLYTREIPDIINIKEITDGISRVENEIKNTSKEATLLAKVAELKEVLNTIDFTAIEQAIQGVENITAKEATLSNGIDTLSNKINNIDLSSVENKIDEGVETLSNKIDNIDLTSIESKVETESQTIQSAIQNIDLSSVESKVDEVKQAVENIKLPEIDTTELAKESTLNEFKGVVENVASIDADILQGKIKIANAICQKGIPSKYTDSLVDMATKIGQISQELYTGTTDYDEMQFPMEYSYNAYRFAKDLMESELPAKYPSYLRDYLVGYGANSFWVGEFAIPYEEVLVLSMADAYYTSDGHFYTHIDGVVTHTLPDGSVETYESNVIEHKCPFNGMGNILIAHIYARDIYSVQSYNNTNLLGVMACGKCAGFTFTNPINYIQSLCEISGLTLPKKSVNISFPLLCIKGLKHINAPLFENVDSNNYSSIVLPDVEELNASLYSNVKCKYPILILPRLKKNTVHLISNAGAKDSQLIFLSTSLSVLYYHLLQTESSSFNFFKKLKVLHMPELEDMNGYSFNDGYNGYFARDTLELIYTPKLKRASQYIFNHNNYNTIGEYTVKKALIDFEVGEVETDLNCRWWTATNVITDPEKTIQLQNNIHNHIAERVKDVNGEAPLTITFSQEVRNILLPETEQVFRDKNWNIAPAKTV